MLWVKNGIGLLRIHQRIKKLLYQEYVQWESVFLVYCECGFGDFDLPKVSVRST